MRSVIFRSFFILIAVVLVAATPLCAEQDTFRWMDFHSAKDQDVIIWVTRALSAEKWTSIREVGVVYDAALVVTTERPSPQSPANADAFAVWSISLTNHGVTPLLKGINLRWLDWMRFTEGRPEEPGILYDNCIECPADTYFTAFWYDVTQHAWAARWMRGGQGIPVWSAKAPAGVAWSQIYAVLSEPDGRELVGTWNHIDYGKEKPAEDFLYQYDLDTFSGLERTQQLNGKQADAMKQRLCHAQEAGPGEARGQDSPLCQEPAALHYERKPVTTPPGNNHGQSVPPGSRH